MNKEAPVSAGGGSCRPQLGSVLVLGVLGACGLALWAVLAGQRFLRPSLSSVEIEQQTVQRVRKASPSADLSQTRVKHVPLQQALGAPLASCSPLEYTAHELRVGLGFDTSNPCNLSQLVWVAELRACEANTCKRVQLIYTEAGAIIREVWLAEP